MQEQEPARSGNNPTRMKWENLKDFNCPHCGKPLENREGEIACTNCFFHISKDRFKAILMHRGQSPIAIQKMKWQNLHDHRCPMDGNRLHEGGSLEMLKCMSAECTFVIRIDSLKRILEDESHPANRFYHN